MSIYPSDPNAINKIQIRIKKAAVSQTKTTAIIEIWFSVISTYQYDGRHIENTVKDRLRFQPYVRLVCFDTQYNNERLTNTLELIPLTLPYNILLHGVVGDKYFQ